MWLRCLSLYFSFPKSATMILKCETWFSLQFCCLTTSPTWSFKWQPNFGSVCNFRHAQKVATTVCVDWHMRNISSHFVGTCLPEEHSISGQDCLRCKFLQYCQWLPECAHARVLMCKFHTNHCTKPSSLVASMLHIIALVPSNYCWGVRFSVKRHSKLCSLTATMELGWWHWWSNLPSET